MEEKRNPKKHRCEIACWVIAGLSAYGGLIAWAAGGSYLQMIIVVASDGIATTILDAAGERE